MKEQRIEDGGGRRRKEEEGGGRRSQEEEGGGACDPTSGHALSTEDKLLSDAPAHGHRHLVLQVGARVQARLQALLRGREEGEAAGVEGLGALARWS